jgi:hypothetical protein
LNCLENESMQDDQVILRIREVRRQISEECDNDPRKLISYYKELQQQHKDRMVHEEQQQNEDEDDLVKA